MVSFVDFLDRDYFNVSGDVMLSAKIEHLLGFRDAADGRAGETAAPMIRLNAETPTGFGERRAV